MGLKDRLLELIVWENLNPNQFYVKSGLGNGFLDKVGEKLKKPSIEKISRVFPHWNIEYLQTGEGEKYYTEKQTIGDITNSTAVGNNIKGTEINITHNDFSEMIVLQKGYQEIIKRKDEGYQEVIKKSQEQISELLLIINKLVANGI